MQKKIKISIVVPVFNAKKTIKKCLNSLLHQDFDGEYEIIVVDGFSNDGTWEILKNYQKKFPEKIRVFRNKKRTVSSNRNFGVGKAKYEYIAFTDADCIVPGDWLRNLAFYYMELTKKMENKKIGGVGGGNIIEILNKTSFLKKYKNFFERNKFFSLNSIQTLKKENIQEVRSIGGFSSFYPKNVLKEVGLFNEKMGNFGEDAEICWRIKKKGYALFYIPKATVKHLWLGVNKFSDWLKKMENWGKARSKMIKIHTDMLKSVYILPLIFALTIPVSLPIYLFLFFVTSFSLEKVFFALFSHIFYIKGMLKEFFKK